MEKILAVLALIGGVYVQASHLKLKKKSLGTTFFDSDEDATSLASECSSKQKTESSENSLSFTKESFNKKRLSFIANNSDSELRSSGEGKTDYIFEETTDLETLGSSSSSELDFIDEYCEWLEKQRRTDRYGHQERQEAQKTVRFVPVVNDKIPQMRIDRPEVKKEKKQRRRKSLFHRKK